MRKFVATAGCMLILFALTTVASAQEQAPVQKDATQAPVQKEVAPVQAPTQKPTQAPTQKDLKPVQKPCQKPCQSPVQKGKGRRGLLARGCR